MVIGKKGVTRFTTLDKLEMYRCLFPSKKEPFNISELKQNVIYLLLDKRTNLIKIGRSKTLRIRERTLQRQNPNWEIITAWIAPQKIENELHQIFSKKRIRGEWFSLTSCDLKDINILMNIFEQILIEG